MRIFPSFLLFIFSVALLVPGTVWSLDKGKYSGGIIITESDQLAPMSFVGVNGAPKGFVIDYWKKWSEKTGIPVTFRLAPWKESLELVKNGEGDLHGGLYMTPEREQYLDFSEPTFPVLGILAVRKKSSITSLDSLGDHIVGVMEKGSTQEILRAEYPNVAMKIYPSVKAEVEAFLEGEVDAVIADQHVLLYLLGTQGVDRSEIREVPVYERTLHAAVAKGNSELLEIVNEGMAMISAREKADILKVWYVPDSSISPTLKFGLGVAVLLLFSGLAYLLFGGRRPVGQD